MCKNSMFDSAVELSEDIVYIIRDKFLYEVCECL